ncbi:MAG: hypothetical protein K9L28_05425 [Synergistales bacterium]|nr:hypothetical protein [Synergistales bacterium]
MTLTDIIKRAPYSQKTLEWSRNKRIVVYNPPFWGLHDIFVDSGLVHAVVCIKEDHTAFVFYGNSTGASEIAKYNENQELLSSEELKPGHVEWTVYADYVLYRGSALPPTRAPYHWGNVIRTYPFEERIDSAWAPGVIRSLIEWHNDNVTHSR